MTNLKSTYREEIIPKLKEELGIKNELALPYIEKIVLNVGAAEALQSKEVLAKIKEQLAIITGHTPTITLAKKSISSFKLKAKDPIGIRVTLRGQKAWDFLEKLISIVIPRMRDFRGMQNDKFDKMGNYSFGITEQTLFPYLDYSKVDKVRGMVVTIVVKKSDQKKSKRMLEFLGMPFRK